MLFQSCVNSVKGEDEDLVNAIPIMIVSTDLHKQIYSSDYDSYIALYAVLSTLSLNKERQTDNAKFACDANGFYSLNNAYYPIDKSKCDLISYHPFYETGIKKGAYTLDVEVQTNQSSLEHYNQSDFMTSFVNNVTPTTKNIKLSYQHQCSQLVINIKASEDVDLMQLKDANPQVFVNNVFLKGIFNFDTNNFESLYDIGMVTPYGNWVVKGDKLVGKQLFLIPQTVGEGLDLLTMKVNNVAYNVTLSKSFSFKNSVSHEVTLLYSPRLGITDIITEISDWKEGSSVEINTDQIDERKRIAIHDFDFNKSNVYQLKSGGCIVAEVCKEYLTSKSFSSQAIVVYPVRNCMTCLNEGFVWKTLNDSLCLYGGRISWDKLLNTFNYEAGSANEIDFISIDSEGNILTTESDISLPVSVKEYIWIDSRSEIVENYPIVKIGCQYWLRENLRAKKYNTGTNITKKTSSTYSKKSAGYFEVQNNIFYNKSAVATGKIAPYGWKIPNNSDWLKLMNYLSEDASLLKSTDLWKGDSATTHGQTDFNAYPTGIFSKSVDADQSVYCFKDQYTAFWMMNDDNQNIWDKALLLKDVTSQFHIASYSDFSGYSIRCLRY